MEQQFIVSCLGRPMELGMLYDCRSEAPVPGVTLWDFKTLRSNSDVHPRESSECEVTADDSMENKAHFMNVEANVKLSFLGGLLKVEGAAKYLDNQRSSAYQARVVLKYSCKSNFEQLTMDHLGMENIKYPDAFDKGMATHVVSAIEYGADAFFVFDRHLSNSESCSEIEGKLKVSLSKIPVLKMISVDGAGAVHMNEEEKKLANSFKCTFHGDIVLKENPTTFDDAMAIYKNLPSLIRESTGRGNIYGIPKKAYLYPLSKLDNRAAKLVRSISDNVVSETQSILEHIAQSLASANDLENSEIGQKFWGIKQQIAKYKAALTQFRASFQRTLCEMLPQIRGGGIEEGKLLKKIQQLRKSPYDRSKLDAWVNMKKREFSCLQSYLKALEGFPLAFQPGDLEQFTQNDNLKYVLCLSLGNITSSEHMFLDLLKEFSLDDESESSVDAWEALEDSWCDDDNITTSLQNQVRSFKDFAAANNDKSDLKFVVVDGGAKKGKAEIPGTMFLYNQGRRQVFQLPAAPGQPEMVSNAENEITITWPAPASGAKCVLYYKILYQPVGATNPNWSHVETTGSELQFTIKQLAPETEYLFKIEAVAEPGKSQSGPQSSPIKTKASPPLAASILHECQLILLGENGQPSWYQLPRRYKDIDKNLRLKRVDIGDVYPDPRAQIYKVVLLVGATGSGKSTLVNGMINYLYGVKRDDPFRLQLIPKETEHSQAHSQTTDVTQYVLHWHPQSRVPYSLVFIDTPGYGDTRGIVKDGELINQIRVFFNKAIDHIDAVGFVVQSALARLTETQKYIFDGILALFGNDIEKNVFLMLTFTDGSTPPVLSAIDEFKIPYEGYFKFNNSVFTVDSDAGKRAELTGTNKAMHGMFWDLAYAAYQDFFNKLGVTTPKSLTLTKEVLQERQRLEHTIDALSLGINNGVNQLITMRAELPFIIEYEAERDANQSYSRTIDVPKTRKIEFSDGHFVTNCAKCSQTCHDPCMIPNDADKAGCAAMGSDGNCRVCKNHCYWNVHFNKNYIYEEYVAREDITIEDMQRKYMEANSKLSLKDNLLVGISKEYDKVQKDVLEAVESIRRCLERLGEIALRPDPLGAVEYINLLIKATKRDKHVGWEQRLDQLENARQRALMIKEMRDKGQNYDPFAKLQDEIKAKASEKTSLKEKIYNLFRIKK